MNKKSAKETDYDIVQSIRRRTKVFEKGEGLNEKIVSDGKRVTKNKIIIKTKDV